MSSSFLQRWLPLTLILTVALALRTWDLAARPMHADEANQAVKLGHLLESGRYAFDPSDHHGPTLYYFALPLAWACGERTLAALSETTVRFLPALAGTLSVGLLALLAWPASANTPRAGQAAPATNPSSDVSAGAPLAGARERRAATPDSASPVRSPVPALALFAAAFLAVAPPAVYYSRYFVQETLLGTFTLGAFVCLQRWNRGRQLGWAIAAGGCVGLMQATKASAPLFLAAAVLAWLVVRPRSASRRAASDRRAAAPDLHGRAASDAGPVDPGHRGDDLRRSLRHGLVALFVGLLVAALFYSSFGTHWAGLRDALATYTAAGERAASGAGQEKPWWYYLQLLGWQRTGGLLWHQLPLTALALCGAALAFLAPRRRSPTWQPMDDMPSEPARGPLSEQPDPVQANRSMPALTRRPTPNLGNSGMPETGTPSPERDRAIPLLRGAAIYTALLTLMLSLVPYKTPWHVIHLLPGLALLAAGALVALAAAGTSPRRATADRATPAGVEAAQRFRRWTSGIATGILFVAALHPLYAQTRLAVFLRSADARNPYAYVHSAPDVQKVAPLAGAALTFMPDGVIRVIAEEYWPLPWYLRGFDRVGYWPAPPDDCDGALVIASVTLADEVRARLHGRYRESLLGLRPGVLLVVFTPES